MFGAPLVYRLGRFSGPWSDEQRALSEAVMTYWTNFAKSGYGGRRRTKSGYGPTPSTAAPCPAALSNEPRLTTIGPRLMTSNVRCSANHYPTVNHYL